MLGRPVVLSTCSRIWKTKAGIPALSLTSVWPWAISMFYFLYLITSKMMPISQSSFKNEVNNYTCKYLTWRQTVNQCYLPSYNVKCLAQRPVSMNLLYTALPMTNALSLNFWSLFFTDCTIWSCPLIVGICICPDVWSLQLDWNIQGSNLLNFLYPSKHRHRLDPLLMLTKHLL